MSVISTLTSSDESFGPSIISFENTENEIDKIKNIVRRVLIREFMSNCFDKNYISKLDK